MIRHKSHKIKLNGGNASMQRQQIKKISTLDTLFNNTPGAILLFKKNKKNANYIICVWLPLWTSITTTKQTRLSVCGMQREVDKTNRLCCEWLATFKPNILLNCRSLLKIMFSFIWGSLPKKVHLLLFNHIWFRDRQFKPYVFTFQSSF